MTETKEIKGNTLFLSLGKQTISGTKSASGRYENPEAGVEIFDKNLFSNLAKLYVNFGDAL